MARRKQFNVRLPEEWLVRLDILRRRMEEKIGIPVSQADVVQAGIAALEKKFLPQRRRKERKSE